jgi:hypothetical protein
MGQGCCPNDFSLVNPDAGTVPVSGFRFAISARPGTTLIGTYHLATSVMAGLVPAIHVFAMAMRESRMGA